MNDNVFIREREMFCKICAKESSRDDGYCDIFCLVWDHFPSFREQYGTYWAWREEIRRLNDKVKHERQEQLTPQEYCKKVNERKPKYYNGWKHVHQYYEKNIIIYECPCEAKRKHLHHPNYDLPHLLIKLCPKCHGAETRRLRRLAATAAVNSPKTSGNVQGEVNPSNASVDALSARSDMKLSETDRTARAEAG